MTDTKTKILIREELSHIFGKWLQKVGEDFISVTKMNENIRKEGGTNFVNSMEPNFAHFVSWYLFEYQESLTYQADEAIAHYEESKEKLNKINKRATDLFKKL